MTELYDAIVVGAGLAGLRCAQVLDGAGKSVLLLERSNHLGGRLHSFQIDEFTLDEGFQLINPSYPELQATGVLRDFDLRVFPASLRFQSGDRSFSLSDPRQSPLDALQAVLGRVAPVTDFVALGRLFARCALVPVTRLLRQPDCTTREGFRNAGVSERTIDVIITPFLKGTLLDNNLDTSWRYTQLLLRSFVRGRPGTHPEGIEALPKAMASRLQSTTIRTGEEVQSVREGEVVTSLASYKARAVVVASNGVDAAALTPMTPPAFRSQTTWWWSTPRVNKGDVLRLELTRNFISSALDISSVAPERSPEGRSLIATPANGTFDASYDEGVRLDVARLYQLESSDVALVSRTVVQHALPVLKTPLQLNEHPVRNVVVFAGDYLQTPSIQGALVSGRRAANAALLLLS